MTKNVWHAVCFFLGSLFGSYAYDLIYKKPEQAEQKSLFVQKEDSIVKEDHIVLNIGDIWVSNPTYIEDPFERSKPMYNERYEILDIKGDYVLYKEFNCHIDGTSCKDSEKISAFVRYKKKLLYN